MEGKGLSTALVSSISAESDNALAGLVEAGLDSLMNDGLLKEVPFISTAVAVYKIGKSVHELYYLKKLALFIQELRAGTATEERREYYRDRISRDPRQRDRELEYIMVLLSRYIGYDKPGMLTKLYLALLDDTIDWDTFTACSMVIDGFLPGDYEKLKEGKTVITYRASLDASLLRLSALGLFIQNEKNSLYESDGQGGFAIYSSSMERLSRGEMQYERTPFGDMLAGII